MDPTSQSGRRTDVVHKVLRAGLSGEVDDLSSLLTEDVVGWTPNVAVSSLAEARAIFGERDEMLSNIDLDVRSVDIVGDKVFAEWQVAADHSGPMVVDEDLVVEPTGKRIRLAGVLVAEFRDDRIAAFRAYFDDLALMEQVLEAG